MDEARPAGEAVPAGDLVLCSAQPDPAFTLAGLSLFAQVLQRWVRWEIGHGEPLSARVRVLGRGPSAAYRGPAAGGILPSLRTGCVRRRTAIVPHLGREPGSTWCCRQPARPRWRSSPTTFTGTTPRPPRPPADPGQAGRAAGRRRQTRSMSSPSGSPPAPCRSAVPEGGRGFQVSPPSSRTSTPRRRGRQSTARAGPRSPWPRRVVRGGPRGGNGSPEPLVELGEHLWTLS